MTSLLVLVSGPAGNTDHANLEAALRVLRSAAEVEVARSTDPGELDEHLAKRAGRTVVVAGGDGSLHAVVAALHRRGDLDSTTIGLLPLDEIFQGVVQASGAQRRAGKAPTR